MPGAGALAAERLRQMAGKRMSARMELVYRLSRARATEVYRITLPLAAEAFKASGSRAPVAQLDRAAVF